MGGQIKNDGNQLVGIWAGGSGLASPRKKTGGTLGNSDIRVVGLWAKGAKLWLC